MNRLTTNRRQAVVACLVEGNSVRATSRLTGVAKGTILKLLVELGPACQRFHDRTVRELTCWRVQCDEIWTFCYCKDKNIPYRLRGRLGIGSVWTWTAMCPRTKLMIAWRVGERDIRDAVPFLRDLASRLKVPIQLTTDGHHSYLHAVSQAFPGDISYAMLRKQYDRRGWYTGAQKIPIIGFPDMNQVSTSMVERQNLTMRMSMRRYTRLTNGFSKKLANHRHAVAVHFAHYNFCRVHQTLRVTPAMEAGLADHIWEINELIGLLGSN